ncbi:MAG: hypothetical protein A2103_00035 [Gammaproteobacteria bacterium GWF2_41_13]|nr:MAG: hypothetical protein A2103_00035 [Gammaproteobacteria bacterium GWF2_41_13]
MKNRKQELLRQIQRQYHQHHPWCLQRGGLYIPHSYNEISSDALSWWDDVGFILNKRRVIVWWQHPRCVYSDAIDEQSWLEAGDNPQDNWLVDDLQKNYRKVGASRKKVISYSCREPSIKQKLYYEHLNNIRERISADGIDLEVYPSWRLENLTWAIGVSLVAPIEIRNEKELGELALLARRLMLGQTKLESEFPAYRYGRVDWLKERV